VIFDGDVKFINEEFHCEHVRADQLDRLLADGWRHFGTHFFRYNFGYYDFDIRRVMPLRIRLSDFSLSKSQRRVLRDNSDVQIEIKPIRVTAETVDLFERHKQRFRFGVPDSIYDFLSDDPADVPCESFEVEARIDGHLVAVSYFDVADAAVSAIYAMFDPTLAKRSLGILTMLKEIEHARECGKEFYYQGYAYEGESFYDYKKRFRGTEWFDWRGTWTGLELHRS
jgi:arginine-tRNA-protein transferase